MTWDRAHLLGTRDLTADEITCVLDAARELAPSAHGGDAEPRTDLRGVSVASLCFGSSFRTRASFEQAARRLGASVVGVSLPMVGAPEGESTLDAAREMLGLGVEAIVVGSPCAGTPGILASHLDVCVVNAGDGAREQPAQALCDLYVMRERFGRLRDLRVLVVGDAGASAVARSNLWALRTVGAEVTLCGPPTLVPRSYESLGARVSHHLEPELERADVVLLLPLSRERSSGGAIPSVREYAQLFALTAERAARLGSEAIIMHPGPVQRGVEIMPDVADSPRAVGLRPSRAGIAVRMAVLKLCVEARRCG
jgi:aspartate carbamoyltransferase catalytic subunit